LPSAAIIVSAANPEIALDNTYLRFNEHGRGAGANAIAKIQANLPIGLAAIRKYFGTMWTLSSVTDVHQKENKNLWVGTTLISLRSEGLMNKAGQQLLDKTVRDYRAGRISYDCYLQAASRPPRRHARRMVRSSSESERTISFGSDGFGLFAFRVRFVG
jgi:hypothetical protein